MSGMDKKLDALSKSLDAFKMGMQEGSVDTWVMAAEGALRGHADALETAEGAQMAANKAVCSAVGADLQRLVGGISRLTGNDWSRFKDELLKSAGCAHSPAALVQDLTEVRQRNGESVAGYTQRWRAALWATKMDWPTDDSEAELAFFLLRALYTQGLRAATTRKAIGTHDPRSWDKLVAVAQAEEDGVKAQAAYSRNPREGAPVGGLTESSRKFGRVPRGSPRRGRQVFSPKDLSEEEINRRHEGRRCLRCNQALSGFAGDHPMGWKDCMNTPVLETKNE